MLTSANSFLLFGVLMSVPICYSYGAGNYKCGRNNLCMTSAKIL